MNPYSRGKDQVCPNDVAEIGVQVNFPKEKQAMIERGRKNG